MNVLQFAVIDLVRDPSGRRYCRRHEFFSDQLGQCRTDLGRGAFDALLQEPPLHNAFNGVLGIGMFDQVVEDLIKYARSLLGKADGAHKVFSLLKQSKAEQRLCHPKIQCFSGSHPL